MDVPLVEFLVACLDPFFPRVCAPSPPFAEDVSSPEALDVADLADLADFADFADLPDMPVAEDFPDVEVLRDVPAPLLDVAERLLALRLRLLLVRVLVLGMDAISRCDNEMSPNQPAHLTTDAASISGACAQFAGIWATDVAIVARKNPEQPL